jgi:hypothetical protein
MKKLLVLFIVLFVAIPGFARDDDQAADKEDSKRAAVTINPNTFLLATISEGAGMSIGFEYGFTRAFSTKLEAYFMAFQPGSIYSSAINDEDNVAVTFRGALEARWYPLGKAIEGLFANAGFQYQQVLGDFTLEEYEYISGQDQYTKFKGDMALGMSLGAGYKFVFGKGRAAFVLEPTLDVVWSYHLGKKADTSGNWLLGMNGVRTTVNLGVAF